MDAKRGFVPADEKDFSAVMIGKLRTASGQICYLLNEGYELEKAVEFVGNHFLLSRRQRTAIARSVAASEQIMNRRRKEISLDGVRGRTVWIDGFNEIITLEVLFCRSILLECMDGAIRDLAGLHGTYRLIPQTDEAISLLLEVLKQYGASSAVFLLDEPISNSGRLKARISEIAEEVYMPVDIQVRSDVDRILYEKDFVITSDSIILDQCSSWVNLSAFCAKEKRAAVLRLFE